MTGEMPVNGADFNMKEDICAGCHRPYGTGNPENATVLISFFSLDKIILPMDGR